MSNTMREILFRGKRFDNGEWVKGFLSKSRNIEEKPALLKPCIDYEEKGVMMSSIVAPETVGQFTGLTDKNGNKIFEGDIVKHRVMYSEGKAIKFEDQIFTVRYSVEQARFLAYLPNGVFNPAAMQDCEVVGNIHNNELLEESNA